MKILNAAMVTAVMTTLVTTSPQLPARLWVDATATTIGDTANWTNKVEIADINGDGRLDLLFANGGNYSEPGPPEANVAFVNRGAGQRFENVSAKVFGPTPDIARVIKARDINGDGLTDIIVGTTYQTQSRLYLGTGGGAFQEVTTTHLPQAPASIGDLEVGDVDLDGDLDMVLADWGPGNNMSNEGGRTKLWLNDGQGRFSDATAAQMPPPLVRFSWDLELADVDNDYDLDVLVSCKRCTGGYLFRNDGKGKFTDDPRALPQYTNNYEYELMDLDGDNFLDIVTINDGEIVKEGGSNRREHVFRNDGKGRFRDATAQWWQPSENLGEDDNMVAFLDYDSDGDADFVIGSLSGPDRLMINDGKGHLTVALDVFVGADTPGTLGLALGDLDGDGRMDVVQAQGEHPTAIQERVFLGSGLKPDTAPPVISMVTAVPAAAGGRATIRARVHDRKSPTLPTEWKRVVVEWTSAAGPQATAMRWLGEYLWTVDLPAAMAAGATYRVCATDAAGNSSCSTSTEVRRP
ncbi:MAG TPA: VCBS repeat-containing protein [Vicinamibacterales bacterium]|nr:VCBS repeat-containing protein [Vicinamibacterales bacterium]